MMPKALYCNESTDYTLKYFVGLVVGLLPLRDGNYISGESVDPLKINGHSLFKSQVVNKCISAILFETT